MKHVNRSSSPCLHRCRSSSQWLGLHSHLQQLPGGGCNHSNDFLRQSCSTDLWPVYRIPSSCLRQLCSNMIWRCFICYIFVALTLKKLLSHINTQHSRSPGFRVVCGIDGCPSEYRVYNSFYYHVKRTHAHHLLQVEAAEEEPTHHGLPGAGERTATICETHASSVAEAEGSSSVIPAVSPCTS